MKVNVKILGKWEVVADQQVNQVPKQRTNVIIYRADGQDPRRSVKALVFREAARTPTIPKKRKR